MLDRTECAAEIIGVPKNTVKTRMLYVRKRIAELILELNFVGTG